MALVAEIIVTGAKRGRGLADKLVVGVTPEMFARLPKADGHFIQTNHPAWALGHLALYPARIMRMMGLDGDAIAAPAAWDTLFKNGTECRDDVEGKLYPAMESVVTAFRRGYDTVLEQALTLDDAAFAKPTPEENYRQAFPTVGTVVNFMVQSHVMMHLGQVSAWRRMMGLGPA